MGKKVKIGKQRKDKFYKLAKETGYRSRAAFKLIQLNRKYEFLQKSRVLIDLCAAPGGWLQVAKENMPVSSVIIGVDLVGIKPIPNVITIEEDITTSKCKQVLKNHLKTWKVDTVLHDGAPNIGKNWLHDAFQQAQLTLQALRLATNFLAKGGSFVTKVFRSKDYHALLWVFQQLFKKVHATKPQASRTESAEIFVVCQHYLAPDRIDPKFLDAKYVFEEVDPEPKVKLSLMHPEKQKKRAEGYPEGDVTLFHQTPVSQFITGTNYMEILNECNMLFFDDPKYEESKHTSIEIKECCKDIKVLGRKELRLLITWRKKLLAEFHPKEEKTKIEKELDSEDEETLIMQQVKEAQMEEVQDLKRKKKKVLKEKRKLHQKLNLKMLIPDDEPLVNEDPSLFGLKLMKNKKQLAEVEKGELKYLDKELELAEKADDGEDENLVSRTIHYDKEEKNLSGLYSGSESEDSDGAESIHSMNNLEEELDDEMEDEEENNPLLCDIDYSSEQIKKKRKVDMWFGKDIFSGIEKDEDEKYEMEQIKSYYENKGALVGGSVDKQTNNTPKTTNEPSNIKATNSEVKLSPETKTKKDETQDVIKGKKRKKTLDIEGLALGTLMIHSKKRKRDIIDEGWNRYTFHEDDVPDWFKTDEEKHNRKQIPVTKELVEEFREKLKEINARPIKKITEAKARKKRKAVRKMEKARKKAEAVIESADMTETEKRQQIKSIYKKTLPSKKAKEVTYVVAKKGLAGKRVRRPQGLKGRFKVVDPRMKKDNQRTKPTKGKGGSKSQKKGKSNMHQKKGNKSGQNTKPQKKR